MPKQARKNVEWEKVSQLLFDHQNFRLSEGMRVNQQKEILEILDRDYEILQIGQSLVDNNYFVEEPLVVIPDTSGKYIVVEGNRRLAALKLLLEKDKRLMSQDSEEWGKLASHLKWDLSEVPVVKYGNRDEVAATLGYRHISGILKWDPLAKTRFINNLIERRIRSVNFDDVAMETGGNRYAIRDAFIAYRIFMQAKSLDVDTSGLSRSFGVFLRALSSAKINKFIGLDKDKSPLALEKPISKTKTGALEELIGFMYGSEKGPAVLSDSRQLTMLGEVLDNTEALNNLRAGRDLEQAYALTGGEERRLVNNLNKASFYLDESLRDAHRHKGSKKVEEIIMRCAETINEILKSFQKVNEK